MNQGKAMSHCHRSEKNLWETIIDFSRLRCTLSRELDRQINVDFSLAKITTLQSPAKIDRWDVKSRYIITLIKKKPFHCLVPTASDKCE